MATAGVGAGVSGSLIVGSVLHSTAFTQHRPRNLRAQPSWQNSRKNYSLGMRQSPRRYGAAIASIKERRWQRRGRYRMEVVSGMNQDTEQLLRSGVVRSVSPNKVSLLISKEGYQLLDVRPIWEREKAHVADSYHVPLFVEDEDTSAITLLKKWIQMGYAGMWAGQKLTTKNEKFLEAVQKLVPKESKVLVVCGEGLRSMLAIDELRNVGYEQLAWVTGGFNNVRDGDFNTVKGTSKLQFATIGGVSEYFLRSALFFQSLLKSES